MSDRHTYHQDGRGFLGADGDRYMAYAGNGDGFNNPAMDAAVNVGPLPRGLYDIGPLEDALNKRGFGPGFMRLTPHKDTVMHGRSGFLIHWNTYDPNPYDDTFPKGASHGCIVMINGANIARIAASPVKLLEVV